MPEAVEMPDVSSVPREDRWLILGSSPSMPQYADRAFKHCGVVCTANAGIFECTHQEVVPDYYMILEVDTPKYYGRYYRKARKFGMKTMTTDLTLRNDPGIEADADILLRVASVEDFEALDGVRKRRSYYADQREYTPGDYVGCAFAGTYLLQYVMNEHKPREVWIVGCEGYKSEPHDQVKDTFDGRLGNKAGVEYTRNLSAPTMRCVVKCHPATTFYFFGHLNYAISGENVVKIDEHRKHDHVFAKIID